MSMPKTTRHSPLYVKINKDTKKFLVKEAKRRDISVAKFIETIVTNFELGFVTVGNDKELRKVKTQEEFQVYMKRWHNK